LKGERINVDDDRLTARKLNRLFDIVDALAFAGSDQDVHRVVRFLGDLVIKADFRQVERDVFLGVPVNRLFQLFFAHRRENDVLDNDRVARNAGNYAVGTDLVIVTDVLDDIRNDVQLHDLAVNYGVAGQIFKSKPHEVQIICISTEFDHLDRARADIQSGN